MKKFFEQKKSAIVSGMSNNKGFSLVELIIVVAIMGVLMGVLAPQYLRFVESTREQADASAVNAVSQAMTIAMATVTDVTAGDKVIVGVDGSLTITSGPNFVKEVGLTVGTNIGTLDSTWAGANGTNGCTLTIAHDGQKFFVYTDTANASGYEGDTWATRLNIPASA